MNCESLPDLRHTVVGKPRDRRRSNAWNTGEDLGALHEEVENYKAARFLPCGATRLVAWDPRKGRKASEVLRGSGLIPDLREAGAETHEQWDVIVRGGFRVSRGMPSFADSVTAYDAEAVCAYVLDRAWHSPTALEQFFELAVDRACIPVSWLTDRATTFRSPHARAR